MTTSDSTSLAAPEELGFTASLEELETIVADLESERLDVDRLSEQVERAAALVEFCRGELDATRMKVTEILERLTPQPVDDSPLVEDETTGE